ncbi:phage tail tape measure protein [Clostridium perfringens]|uniref:Phage tail tape measure protein n=1 Tax=Clostridium perfringens TaxID=1502 RepID=A0AAW4J687_CLOPF|nr:phage tail tape measure protein [Clostridium perfringens]MBO3356245.1 phage tail tape measure protein [Clostridium perfringens]MBO3359414.1 phage tail tape measure protein [Clostridium perfringens]
MSLNLSFGGKLNKDKVLQQLEKDIKSLSKNLGVELEKVSLKDVDKATSQIQKQINQLSKNINLKISKINLGNNEALQDIQQQINSTLKGEKINLEVKNNIKEVSSEFNVLDDKLKNSFLKQEQYLSQLENRLNKIKERSVTQHTKNENYDNSRDLNSIQNIQNRINEIKAKNIRLSQEEKNIMQQQLIELDAYIKKESSKSAEINRSARFLTSQLRTLENLKVRVDNRGGKSNEQARISNELERQINLYKQLIAQNEILGSVERNRIQKNVNDLKVQSRELVTTSQFSNIFARMKDYFIGGSIIGASIGVLKSSFDTIVEVDNSMRDLKKVTNETSQEYEAFENQANDMAKALGNQTKNVIEATDAFAQMSYSYQESKELAENSIIFQNVGDIDSESANKGLIATMKAYNIQAKDSMDIIDKLNNVSNHYAVSVGGLNDAIMRGGSALSTANNDLSQSIALITTANSAIQDPAKVGNALKTISMNMRGMKQKGGETFPKLKKMLDETTHGSVKLTQVTKEGKEEFRSTYDVIKDLSMVWDDLNNMQKSMIAEKFAGKQNANVFFSLMLNAKKDLESIKETADDSFQSAAQEQEAYMNSLSAKINSLKEDFKGLFLDLGDTDLLKNIIGGVDVGVNALRTLIKTFGALPSTVGLASASMVMFNQKTRNALNKNNILFFRDMENGFKRVTKQSRVAQIGILRDLVKLKAQFKSGEITNKSYAMSLVGIKAKMTAVKLEAIATRVAVTALEGVLSFGIGIGISLVIEGITKLINKLVNAKSQLREFNQDIANSFNSNIEDIKKSEGLVDKINNTKIQISNTSDTQKQNELKKQLLDYEKQLADVLPNAATEFDNEGNAIATNTKLIEENIRQKKQQAKDEVGSFIEKNKKFKEHVDEYIKDQKRLQENQLKLRQVEESNKNKKWYERTENTTALEKDIKKAKEEVKDYSAEINNLIKMKKGLESAGVSKSDIANIIGQDNLDALDQYNQYLQQTQSSADNAKPSIDQLAEGIENTGYDAKEAEKELKALSDAFSGLRGEVDILTEATKEFQKNGQLSANIVEKIFASGDPRLISLLADQNHFMENSIALEKELKEERESAYTQEIEQAQYMVQNGIQAENDKTQVAASGSNDRINITNNETAQKSNMYSNDTVNHANSEDTKVANAQNGADTRTEASSQETNNKAEHYKTDSSNHANLVDTKNKAAIDGANTIQTANSSMINNMGDAYKRDVDNFDNACQTKALSAMQLTKKLHDMMAQVGLGYDENGLPNSLKPQKPHVPLAPGAEWKWDGAQWSAWTKHSINPVKVANNPVKVDYSPEANGHGHKGSGSKGNKGKGSKNGEHVDIKDIEDKIDAYKSLTDAIDDVNNELEITKTLEENAQGVNKLQYMNKEINLYKQKKDAINNLIAAKQNEGRYLEGVLKSNGFNAFNGNISNYYDRLKQIEDEVNAMDNSNKAKEQAIKNFKDLKEKADKYFEITSKELPKLNNEWYALAKTIKEVSEKQVKLMGDTEREMTNVVKNQVEQRKKAREDEANHLKEMVKKERDEYNKKYDDENFEKNLKEKQDKLNKLNAQIDSVRRDISSEGQSKLKDLLKQKDDLEKELNNFIRDRQKDQGNKAFDEQMDKIDKHKDEKIKEMEKTYTDEKIAELAKGMIQKGFIEIEGHVIKLRDALNDYYKKNGEVFADSSLKMQEYIDNLELTKKLYGELTSINNNLGVSSSNIRYNSGNNVVQAIPKVASFMAIPQGSKKANIKIESNLHIGSVHEGKVDDIKSMLDERDRKIINEINEQLNSY